MGGAYPGHLQLQETMTREIFASPSGSSALWLPRDAFADRRRQRLAEDFAAG